ncbi:MAG: hypothetical protein A2287_00615 [Candidatus Melainabacteria bacterium RIFOXYA12_FULL_32_12]|nr:MAG: hypothetical protein A2287_00615 [Candidatus Melainabacteria bacterium RIFOXYA12_FULL_32_12]
MKINEFESKNYTTYFRGRAFDSVTEYSYISPNNLNTNEFEQLLKENQIILQGGYVSYIKKQLALKSGNVLYKHIAKLECSVN